MTRLLDWIAKLCMGIAGLLLVILIVIFGWLVFGRYVLNNTPTWVEQVSLLIIAYITFLGAAIGIRENSHLSIDFIRDSLPDTPKLFLALLSDAALFVFGVIMAWQGYKLVLNNMDRVIPMLGLPEAWRAAPLAICGALMAIFSLANLLRRLVPSQRNGA